MVKRALFPGSFDPLTRGHVDLIERALAIFDELTIGVLSNTQKANLFTIEERVQLIADECARFGKRVHVKSFTGLLVDFARQEGAQVVMRGLRAISDYDYEAQMALMNKHLWEQLETLFFTAREANSYVSSSLVKSVAALGGDVSKLVTPPVAEALKKKFNRSKP